MALVTVTTSQAIAIIAVVDLLKTGIITYAQYKANLNKVLNMTDIQLNVAIANENVDSDLLMVELDKM